MPKKILLISSTPRKGGNSEILCKHFMEGATEAGHICELVCLREKNISPCRACEACHKGDGTCVIKDDAPDILQKMIDADVIVLATPIYFYTVSAQLKAMIDRTYPRYREIANKEFYFIATVATEGKDCMERTFDSLRGFTDCLKNPMERGVIYGDNTWEAGDVEKTPAYIQSYEMGKNV